VKPALKRVPRVAAVAVLAWLAAGAAFFAANAHRVALGYRDSALRDAAWSASYARAAWLEGAFGRLFLALPLVVIAPTVLLQLALLAFARAPLDAATRRWLLWTTVAGALAVLVVLWLGSVAVGVGMIG
jgi:hypothetical protein